MVLPVTTLSAWPADTLIGGDGNDPSTAAVPDLLERGDDTFLVKV